jgi:predicted nucleotidyltransferase
MEQDAQQLMEKLREAARAVFDGTDVFLAYAHGSRIHGRARADSDVDVAYYAGTWPHTRRLPLDEELQLEGELSAALGMQVDLRSLADAPLEVRGTVLEKGVRVYASDEVARVNLEANLMTRWHDWKPACQKMHEERLRAIAEKGLRHGRQAPA